MLEGRASGSGASSRALARMRAPMPRLNEGRALAEAGVSAMIDVSDGIASDAAHLARASAAQLRVRLERLPLHEGVAEVCAELERSPHELAASGGEDYELCFCVAPEHRASVRALCRSRPASASRGSARCSPGRPAPC